MWFLKEEEEVGRVLRCNATSEAAGGCSKKLINERGRLNLEFTGVVS